MNMVDSALGVRRCYLNRPWCPPSSSTSATIMPAYTSAFAIATIRPDQFLICNLRSPGGRGISDITAQAHWHQLVLQHRRIHCHYRMIPFVPLFISLFIFDFRSGT